MDIVEFLRARLDEEEVVARETIAIRLRVYEENVPEPELFKAWDDHPAGVVIVGAERVLREVEAKRRIVDLGWHHLGDEEYGWGMEEAKRQVLRIMATVYADHPDYQEEWRS